MSAEVLPLPSEEFPTAKLEKLCNLFLQKQLWHRRLQSELAARHHRQWQGPKRTRP